MYRTHTCSELNDANVGQTVTLSGWVHRRRDHGGVIFIDLRDRYGLTQIVSDPINFDDVHNAMDKVRSEFVVKITGDVRLRPDSQYNENLETGKIEINVTDFEILSSAKTPPFEIDQDKQVSEDLRLKYRYLDLRRERMKNNIVLRHKMVKFMRDYFSDDGFLEIETPILIKGTPEGSREYLVPSRLYPGNFYVLPQSPQQLKQLLMVSGMDKYFQMARCFRDEDQRGDRQPEFTQVDLEMSFVTEKEMMALIEGLLLETTKRFAPDKKIMTEPFPVFTYEQAMNRFGSDKPDIRFGLEFSDVTEIVKDCGFGVFSSVATSGGVVKALKVDGASKLTRREIDEITEVAKIYGARGLAYIVLEEDGNLKSPIVKYFEKGELEKVIELTAAKPGDIVFFTAADFVTACESLGAVRLDIAKRFDLVDPNLFAYCWVNDFPMFEKDAETGALAAVHHPFTSPQDNQKFVKDPASSTSIAYDVVLNGNEIGGGSIRIHDAEIQAKVFEALGISLEDVDRRFGHILQAFEYGVPPHGGLALGLDRLVMLFAGEANIREVIPFPKDQKARDLMLGAPSQMPSEQIDELHIELKDIE